MSNKIIRILSTKIEYYALITYLFFGTFAFTISYADNPYIDILLSMINNKIFLVVFMLPSFVLFWNMIIKYSTNDYQTIIRMGKRKNYIIFLSKELTKASCLLFFQYIVFQLICINLTSHTNIFISNTYNYNVNDFVLYIVCVIRLFLNIITIKYLFSFLYLNIRNKEYSIFIMFTLFIIIYFCNRLFFINSFFNYINIGYHYYGIDLTNNIYELIISNILFNSILSIILIILMNKKIKKINFYTGNRR